MDTEHRFILILALIATILLTILAFVLLIVLSQFQVFLGFVFLSLIVLVFLLLVGIIINEQILRHRRVKYHTEIPLGPKGTPFYIPQEMKQYQREGNYD